MDSEMFDFLSTPSHSNVTLTANYQEFNEGRHVIKVSASACNSEQWRIKYADLFDHAWDQLENYVLLDCHDQLIADSLEITDLSVICFGNHSGANSIRFETTDSQLGLMGDDQAPRSHYFRQDMRLGVVHQVPLLVGDGDRDGYEVSVSDVVGYFTVDFTIRVATHVQICECYDCLDGEYGFMEF